MRCISGVLWAWPERLSWRREPQAQNPVQTPRPGGQDLSLEARKETLKDKEPLRIGCYTTAASVWPEWKGCFASTTVLCLGLEKGFQLFKSLWKAHRCGSHCPAGVCVGVHGSVFVFLDILFVFSPSLSLFKFWVLLRLAPAFWLQQSVSWVRCWLNVILDKYKQPIS